MARESDERQGADAVRWDRAGSELLRAVRGHRSQVAFSRWLGYRSNVAANWEGGHRYPTGEELMRALRRVDIDPHEAARRFHPSAASVLEESGLAAWLDVLRGHTPRSEVARRAGVSRHQAQRWLTGAARPRVPELLRLLEALTGRAADWVAQLVPISQVPTLEAPWRRARAAARLAYDAPWAAAVRLLITTEGYRSDPTDARLAAALDLPEAQLSESTDALLEAGLAQREDDGRLVPTGAFTADVRASADDHRRLKAHWARFGAERTASPHPDDLVSFNLVTLSHDDLHRVRELQRAYFRELRSLVSASKPEQTAALVLMQVLPLQ